MSYRKLLRSPGKPIDKTDSREKKSTAAIGRLCGVRLRPGSVGGFHAGRALIAAATLWTAAGENIAQDYRIYTVVYDEAIPGRHVDASGVQEHEPVAVARTLSLFHAGKVYDSIPAIDEVIIFDPGNRRFTILNVERTLATIVDFEKLQDMLALAREATQQHIAEIESSASPDAKNKLEPLRFQLAPGFDEQYDPQRGRIILSSPRFRYVARCADDQPAETVTSYLRYADWMCRLNYVLHPNVLLPELRLELNDALRRRKLLPYEVELQADVGVAIHLRAEHRIHWKLFKTDRSLIHHWESMIANDEVRFVTFREYQSAVLNAALSSRR